MIEMFEENDEDLTPMWDAMSAAIPRLVAECDDKLKTALERGSFHQLLREQDMQNLADLAKIKDNVNLMRTVFRNQEY